MKPTKRGYKVWILSESTTGYVYNFEINTVKDTKRNLPLGEHAVMTRIRKIDLNNCQLFFDNYFNSLQLLYELKKKILQLRVQFVQIENTFQLN